MTAMTETKKGGIGPGAVAALVVVAVGGGFFLSRAGKSSGDKAQEVSAVPAGAVDASVERFKVPVGNAPVQGPATAKVTIIEWSDFQCPFCSRVVATMEQIEKAYPKDVRVAFKHNPLPFHPNAMPAAQATIAAGAQGKFWEMHNALFKNQQNQSREDFDKYAKELGLDLAKFKADFDAPATKERVQQEMQDASKFGARGTPSFFINGRPLSGAQPFDNFKKIIDEEILAADKAIKAGVAAAAVYDALTKAGKTSAGADPAAQQRPTPPPADTTVYKVPVGSSPQKGAKDALATIVIFSDFQCPFCSRVETTLTEVEKNYGDKVRFVWKNNPLPFHQNAGPASEAAMAAHYQGKFWEMHDTLFKNQGALERASLEKYAADLGLNASKFKAVLDTEKFKKEIEADQQLAAQLGARGTPSFFINGKNLRGAQPYESFKKAVDTAIADAETVIKTKGVNKAGVYDAIIKDGKEKSDIPAPPKQQPQAQDTSVYKALVGDAPVKGPKTAKVTIVEFSDFQCPFCSRVEPTVDQVMKAYPNDVRVAFKQLPLPFHNNAHAAAEAALAAKEQGKFWEMHAKLFKSQQALDKDSLAKYAGELGLNVEKFKAALESGKYKDKVDLEMAEGNKIGARGTPSFFVNGKSFVGAQPFEAFKAKIEEEIKNADAFMAQKHVKADKLYDELMKDAKEGSAPPPAQAAAAEAEDKTIYKVDGGNGPSKGPAGAPVQIVEFSDFQCPFCSRVVPTVHQIMEKYGNKVRITWRNYPLPFHQNAEPAAEAAMAAAAQGKFWEMHD